MSYDPLGTEVILWGAKDAFDITAIKGGVQTVIEGDEQLWSWRIKPLKAGKHLIVLKAKVQFIPEGRKEPIVREFVTFQEQRRVKVNVGYSFQKFAEANQGQIITLIVGPGSVAGIVSWLIIRNQARVAARAKAERQVGFIGAIAAKQDEKPKAP